MEWFVAVSSPLRGDSPAQGLCHGLGWQELSASLWCLQGTSSKSSGFQTERQGTPGVPQKALGITPRVESEPRALSPPLQPKQLTLALFYKVGPVRDFC